MPTCEMCGKEASLVKARIEGTELELCEECARFGEIISRPKPIEERPKMPARRQVFAPKRKETVLMIVSDYAKKIRQAREKTGLTQEEFAKKLNEKWSVMQKIESGQFKPSIDLARKLEKILGIELVEQHSEGGEIPLPTAKKKEGGFTLGDFVKRKKQ